MDTLMHQTLIDVKNNHTDIKIGEVLFSPAWDLERTTKFMQWENILFRRAYLGGTFENNLKNINHISERTKVYADFHCYYFSYLTPKYFL